MKSDVIDCKKKLQADEAHYHHFYLDILLQFRYM